MLVEDGSELFHAVASTLVPTNIVQVELNLTNLLSLPVVPVQLLLFVHSRKFLNVLCLCTLVKCSFYRLCAISSLCL